MANLNNTPLRMCLRDNGPILSTRERGRRAGDQLRALAGDHQDVILDFEGVEAATPPFLHELMDALQSVILRDRDQGRIVLAANMNNDVAETMEFVLGRRKTALPYKAGKQIELLGDLPFLADTLRHAQKLRSFTAPELARTLKIQSGTANKRLEKLLEAGAVRRERDLTAKRGLRHIYHAVSPELAKTAK